MYEFKKHAFTSSAHPPQWQRTCIFDLMEPQTSSYELQSYELTEAISYEI